MDYTDYNDSLVRRFVSDNNLSIPTINAELFLYFLNLYEERYGSYTKWKELVDTINSCFGGEIQSFLDNYYRVRDEIISAVKCTAGYNEFNTCDMGRYAFDMPKGVTKNSVYNEANDGKRFISIDLKKANFQALKFVNKDIVLGADTYEDLVGRFSDVDYIKNSKYTRQVIFGQLNPSRTTTVEKYIMSLINGIIGRCGYGIKLVSFMTDELIYEADDQTCAHFENEVGETLRMTIKNELGVDVRVTPYKLECLRLKSVETNHTRKAFFLKSYFNDNPFDVQCLPLTYFAIGYKLVRGLPVNEQDKHFLYEDCDCIINENFKLSK